MHQIYNMKFRHYLHAYTGVIHCISGNCVAYTTILEDVSRKVEIIVHIGEKSGILNVTELIKMHVYCTSIDL